MLSYAVTPPTDPPLAALQRAERSLDGLSMGDAFGEQFFVAPEQAEQAVAERWVPENGGGGGGGGGGAAPGRWRFTDDTMMGLSIVACLRRFGRIDPDWLARSFAERYEADRGYGPSMHNYLAGLRAGGDWRRDAPALFNGRGSHGNGAAMRAAPVGAYFAGDAARAAEQAALSARVTHANNEAVAGAVAVAVAAATAPEAAGDALLRAAIDHTPDSVVRAKLRQAARLGDGSARLAASVLGNGTGLSAQDTVPFAVWCAAREPRRYDEALWLAVSALGDRDTICAITGGIVALSADATTVPEAWRDAREALPVW